MREQAEFELLPRTYAPLERAAALHAHHELEQGRSEGQGQGQGEAGNIVVSRSAEQVVGDDPSAAACETKGGQCGAEAAAVK